MIEEMLTDSKKEILIDGKKHNKEDLKEVAEPIKGKSYYYNTGLNQNRDNNYEYKLLEYIGILDGDYIVKDSEVLINTDKLYELKTKLETQYGGKRKTRRKKMTKKRQRKNNRK